MISASPSIQIPIHRAGAVVAHAQVDPGDASLVSGRRWSLTKDGYASCHCRRNGRWSRVYMHRLVLNLDQYDGSAMVDHLSGDKLDNRRANLRVCSNSTNQLNRKRPNRGSSAPALGVYFVPRLSKFKVQVMVRGERKYLGLFRTVEEAEQAAIAERGLANTSTVKESA